MSRGTARGRSVSLAARAGMAAVVAARLARAARPTPPVLPEPGAALDGTVSVVVPARDEAARIGPLLAAVCADPQVHEVVVVDDESTDDTAAVAAAAGARVVRGAPLPEGWAGKCWALQQGCTAATGTWVVCLDADTEPAPGLAAALVRRAAVDRCDALTAGARFVCDTPGQRWLHPAMLTTLVVRFGPPAARPFTRRGRRPGRMVANGQCLVLPRERFLRDGGWEPVRSSLVEDVALVRHLAAQGWRIGFVDASPALEVRMHDTAADTWRAWGRSLPLRGHGADGRALTPWPWLVADLAAVWVAQGLPLLRLATRRADAVDLALLALRLGTLAGTAPAYRRRGAAYWLSPLADPAVAVRLTGSALRPERRWRGRSYTAG